MRVSGCARASSKVRCLVVLMVMARWAAPLAAQGPDAPPSLPAAPVPAPAAAFPASAGPAGQSGLAPAFRLPVGGRVLADPVIDVRLSPAAVWVLSEDSSLYLLTEAGVLLARVRLDPRPLPFLALDASGRALVIQIASGPDAAAQGATAQDAAVQGAATKASARLLGWTRSGRLALSLDLGAKLGAELKTARPSVAIGADGRLFIGAGRELRCYAASGSLLWQLGLDSALACPLGVDGSGRLLVGTGPAGAAGTAGAAATAGAGAAASTGGKAPGSLLVLSPYGVEEGRLALSAAASVAGAFVSAPWRGAGKSAIEPVLAVGSADGSLTLAGGSVAAIATARLGAAPVSLATDGESLFVLTATGRVSRLDRAGRIEWSEEIRVLGGRLSLFQDRLVATGAGRAVSLRKSGAILREASLTNAAATSVVSPTGLLFSPGADWILGAYNFEPSLGQAVRPPPPPYLDESGVAEESIAFDPAIADSGRRLALLADIEKELDSGTLGADEGRAGALAAAVALGHFEKDYPASVARFRQDPLPRAKAVYILGRLGSPDRLETLCEVLRKDGDDAVRAAALDAMARIGVDPRGLAGDAIEAAVSGKSGRLSDEVAISLVRAVETLALRSGSPPSASSIRALLALTQAPYGADVRGAAGKALGHIAGTLGP